MNMHFNQDGDWTKYGEMILRGNSKLFFDAKELDIEISAPISTEERVLRLYAWDFSRILVKILQNNEISKIDSVEMLLEYKRYVELHIRYGSNMPMSVRVDPAWHTHILFTQDYQRFCQYVIGHFLHHEPTISDEDVAALKDRYESVTISRYTEHFGEASEKWWPRCGQICEPPGCHSGCGDA